MRTVSFSDQNVRNTLNRQFVNTYTNTYGDSTSGMSIKHSPNESPGPCLRGNGKQNVQTIFMTPDGEIFHVATGYQSAEDLLQETDFALKIFQRLQQTPTDRRQATVAQIHQERLNTGEKNSRRPLSEFDNVLARMVPNQMNFGKRVSTLPGSQVLGQFTQMGVEGDQQFSIQYPLISYRDLERDPTKLVGNGSSFFASSGMGTEMFSK